MWAGEREETSGLLGWAAVLCWVVAGAPILYQNFVKKKCTISVRLVGVIDVTFFVYVSN